ncbi:hypothetical protein BBP40_006261 [Aspergillus hancockii]|nr:hypothetical protein BBP40_006261 [Aspergillus hancockii]
MKGDETEREMIDDIALAPEREGTEDEIGADPEIAVTASAIGIGETGREAVAATDTMISEGIPPKEKDTVTVLNPLFETETGIDPGHLLFEDLEEIAGDDKGMDIDDAGEDDVDAIMRRSMGFSRFRSTKNTKVPGNDVYGVRKEKKTEYRQYMNRIGGFNRPLSPS